MSMLTFYINRAGKDLPAARKRVLERAKDALRAAFHKTPKRKKAKADGQRFLVKRRMATFRGGSSSHQPVHGL